jgi:hypothetical protein
VGKEALVEALARYPTAASALTFFWYASGLGVGEPTEEQIAWAKERVRKSFENKERETF